MTEPTAPAPTTDLSALADERFVSLTTFRRSGAAVATPVWVTPYEGAQIVVTGSTSGKVKRLRNNPRVTLRPCGRTGRVAPDAPTYEGVAQIVSGALQTEPARAAIVRKYGWQAKLIPIAERVRRRGAENERVILRITSPPRD